MASIETSKAIAIKLASLDERDTNWILEQLDETVRLKIEPLIVEVRELGLEQKQLAEIAESYDVASLINVEESNHASQIIDSVSHQEITEILAKEHPYYYQQLVSAFDWKWKPESSKVGNAAGSNKHDKPLLTQAIISVCESKLRSMQIEIKDTNFNSTLLQRVKSFSFRYPKFRRSL